MKSLSLFKRGDKSWWSIFSTPCWQLGMNYYPNLAVTSRCANNLESFIFVLFFLIICELIFVLFFVLIFVLFFFLIFKCIVKYSGRQMDSSVLHKKKYYLNFVKSNQIWIVSILFRLIWHQTELCLVVLSTS